MSNSLLLLNINIEVAHHDNGTICPDAFLAPAELSRLHITLEYVHSILLVERHPGHLIKANNIVLANQTTLPV
ncbi:hypothetical protein SDC9_163686 [bioreactor metagenome]|uniref:Uncharacterized protein n=1 Tax=bioreactor metagenome TaxID=1076179 RepID=A0A645FPJ6_9ZZZZ